MILKKYFINRYRTMRKKTTFYLAVILICISACGDLNTTPLPPGIQDKEIYSNQVGAFKMYKRAVSAFHFALPHHAVVSGLLADEIDDGTLGGSSKLSLDQNMGAARRLSSRNTYELRTISEEYSYDVVNTYVKDYENLQNIRGFSYQALGALRKYGRDLSPALQAELYSYIGFAEIFLADFFCSGIPLSTVDFEADFTYVKGSSTTQVYEHAVAMFDSALAIGADSAWLIDFARVGKGRALIALGRVKEAEEAVIPVRKEASYSIMVDWKGKPQSTTAAAATPFFKDLTLIDRKGTNGFPYNSNGDPRTAFLDAGRNTYNLPLYFPRKYISPTSVSKFVVADWVEAQLIIAESKLKEGKVDEWLGILNKLRSEEITPALDNLVDPVDPQERLKLQFYERAAWTFVTGKRIGDMRRLIRNYKLNANDVFPVGIYSPQGGVYGELTSAPVPAAESIYNIKYKGCNNDEQ